MYDNSHHVNLRDLKARDYFRFIGEQTIFRIIDNWTYASTITGNRYNVPLSTPTRVVCADWIDKLGQSLNQELQCIKS